MTPKFLSRGVLTELISLYWLLGPGEVDQVDRIIGDHHLPPLRRVRSEESSKNRWG